MKINVDLIFKNDGKCFFENSRFDVFVNLKKKIVFDVLQKIISAFLFDCANLIKIIQFAFFENM